MKFKVDENLPVEIADLLRSAKHDVTTVHESHPLRHHLWIVEEGRVRVWGEETES